MNTKVDQMQKILKDREMEMLFARVASNLLAKGNVSEATKICESGLKKFPMYAQGHFVMALCYDKDGRTDEARGEYERTLKYDPNHLNALKKLTEIYHTAGFNDLYRENTIRSGRLNPFDAEIQQQVSDLSQEESEKAPDAQVQTEKPAEKTPQEKGKDPLDVPKIDLSQFDNQEDDFTTIIQGKTAEEDETDRPDEADVNLSVGAVSADLKTDTEADNRMEYEQEQRLSAESSTENEADNYEDLDELEFDNDQEGKEVKTDDHDEWVTGVGENDATEIVMRKNEVDSDSKAGQKQESDLKKADDAGYQQPKIVTQTLGEILVSQKKYVQALKVFETLQDLHPENKNIFQT